MKRFKASILIQASSQFARGFLLLVSGIALSRHLGPERLGLLAFSFAIVEILKPIFSVGISEFVKNRLTLSKPEEQIYILWKAINSQFCISVVFWALLFVCLMLLNLSKTEFNLIFIYSFSLLFLPYKVFDVYFFQLEKGLQVALIELIAVIFDLIFFITLISLSAKLEYFAFAAISRTAVPFFLNLIYFHGISEFRTSSIGINFVEILKYAKGGAPFVLAGLSVVLYVKLDLVMLQQIKGEHDVGIYSVASSLSSAFYFLPSIFSRTLFFLKNGEISVRFYRWMWLLGLLLSFNVAIALPFIVPLVYGVSYQNASTVLVFFVLAPFSVAMGLASTSWLNASSFPWHISIKLTAGAFANLFLNYALIPPFGMIGAAIATSISYFVSFAFYAVFGDKFKQNATIALWPFLPAGK